MVNTAVAAALLTTCNCFTVCWV